MSPAHEQAWREAERLWNVLGDVPAAEPATARPVLRGRRSGARAMPAPIAPAAGSHAAASRYRGIATGAGALIAACLLLILYPSLNIWLSADYSTGIAQMRQIALDDGSHVYLAADSAIDVDFAPGQRRVRLLTGEAYFEVTPDAARPFIVRARDVAATVLGTAFDVGLMTDSVAVAVNHGRVAVADHDLARDTGAPLGAGDWMRVRRAGGIRRGSGSPELVAAWRTGKLIVDDEAVGDVVDALRRYYRGKIVLLPSGLSERRVTGVYNLDDPLGALQAVVEAHGAYMRQISPWLVVVYGG